MPDMVKPEDFKKIEGLKLIYHGRLKDYNVKKINLAEKVRLNSIKEIATQKI